MGAWLGDGPREPAPGWGRALASQTSPVATELAGRSPALAGLCPLPEAFLLLFSCAARKIPPWLSWAKPQLHLRAREALRLVQVSCCAETCAVPTVPAGCCRRVVVLVPQLEARLGGGGMPTARTRAQERAGGVAGPAGVACWIGPWGSGRSCQQEGRLVGARGAGCWWCSGTVPACPGGTESTGPGRGTGTDLLNTGTRLSLQPVQPLPGRACSAGPCCCDRGGWWWSGGVVVVLGTSRGGGPWLVVPSRWLSSRVLSWRSCRVLGSPAPSVSGYVRRPSLCTSSCAVQQPGF